MARIDRPPLILRRSIALPCSSIPAVPSRFPHHPAKSTHALVHSTATLCHRAAILSRRVDHSKSFLSLAGDDVVITSFVYTTAAFHVYVRRVIGSRRNACRLYSPIVTSVSKKNCPADRFIAARRVRRPLSRHFLKVCLFGTQRARSLALYTSGLRRALCRSKNNKIYV